MNKAAAAFIDGLRRVARAPVLVAGVFAVTVLVAIPAGHLVQISIAEQLGHSRVAEQMAEGVSLEWWDAYGETASGLGRSFAPTIIGFAAVLDNLSRLLDARPPVPAVAALGALYLLLWVFLLGGVIDRLARNRPIRTQAFFAACGVYGVRFLRLAVVAAAGYVFLFGVVHGWLFDGFYRWATIDMTVERTAFFLRASLYALFGALVVTWTLMLDYAKVRVVVEDRRSVLGAFIAGSRFALKHPVKIGTLWLLNAAALLLVLGVYAAVAPGASGAGWQAWAAFGIGQAYVLLRVLLKLAGYASQTALFQSMLAHGEYAAAPIPTWPESPTVEGIANAVRNRETVE